MGIVNHLKGLDAQKLYHAVAYGKHLVIGNLTKSHITGAEGSHVITLQQMLGRGPWNACKGLWFRGLEVKPDKYIFRPGTRSTGMSDPVQGQSTVFDTDVPHSEYAWMEAELEAGLGDFDTQGSPPVGLQGIFETMLVQDYLSDGSEDGDPAYSTNAALQTADLVVRLGRRPTSRIDWGAWTDWRDYLAENILHDYTTLAGGEFDGFGLTTTLYNGTAFDTLVSTRIDPVLEFPTSAGSPGVGVDVDNFSVRWEGKIKALFTETYTFRMTHTHGAKLWINGSLVIDEWASSGTHTADVAMTAGAFVTIKIEWKHTTGSAEFKLEWEADSQNREVINHRCLYPKAENRPRYETHPFFASPTRLDDAVKTVLGLCNSVVQEVNGKLRFLCLEQLSTSDRYHFTNDRIVDGTLQLKPRDLRALRNSWQVHFRDIDSQYLEEPIDPVLIERPDLIELAGRKIDGESIELFSCHIHQAYRTLDNIVRRTVDSKWIGQFTGTADTFPVLAGDRSLLDIEFRDETNVDLLILESNDASGESTADERSFTVQQWPDFTEYEAV